MPYYNIFDLDLINHLISHNKFSSYIQQIMCIYTYCKFTHTRAHAHNIILSFLIKLKLIHIRDVSWVGYRLVQKRHLDNKEVEDKFSRNNMFLT